MGSIEFARFPFIVREEWMKNGLEPQVATPCLEKTQCPGYTDLAIKWFGKVTPEQKTRYQFFFPAIPPTIPEWDLIALSEWTVVAIGTWGNLQEKFCTNTQTSIKPEEWIAVITVNHDLTDLQGQQMLGCLFAIRLVARILPHNQLLTPEEFICEDLQQRL